jgi:hypothetical protein
VQPKLSSVDPIRTSDATKKMLETKINPSDLQVRVISVRNVQKGGVLIECETQGECQILKNEVNKSLNKNFEAKIPEKRNPDMILIGLQAKAQINDVLEDIVRQNPEISQIIGNNNVSEYMKYRFTKKTANQHRINVVIEVKPQIRTVIKGLGKINIGWERIKVSDFLPVIRCYKCCAFGHISKYCTEEVGVCPVCAEGHSIKVCPNKTSINNSQNKCINCIRSNLKIKDDKYKMQVNHSALDNNCPCFKRIEKIIKSKINYG